MPPETVIVGLMAWVSFIVLDSCLGLESDDGEDVITGLDTPRLRVLEGLSDWPTNSVVDSLCAESSGVASGERLVLVSFTKNFEMTEVPVLEVNFNEKTIGIEPVVAMCGDEEICCVQVVHCGQKDKFVFEDIILWLVTM